MKKLFIIFLLFPMMAHAATSTVQKYPPNCLAMCEGYMFSYAGTKPDHSDGFNHFVWNKQQKPPNDKQDWAASQADAQKISDNRYNNRTH